MEISNVFVIPAAFCSAMSMFFSAYALTLIYRVEKRLKGMEKTVLGDKK